MPRKSLRDRQAAMRTDLLEALIEYRGGMLMEATAAACALVAHADGEVDPAEMQRLLGVARTEPLLSLFPRDLVIAEFEVHTRALVDDPETGRAAALRRIVPLAAYPRLARVVLGACLDVTPADGLVHPMEVEAIRLVRDALGLAPEPGGTPAQAGRREPPAAIGAIGL